MLLKIILLPWNILRFLFRNPCDIYLDVKFWNVREERKMLIKLCNLRHDEGILKYLNRSSEHLSDPIHNQKIGITQVVKNLKMSSYEEQEVLRHCQYMEQAAFEYGSSVSKNGKSIHLENMTRELFRSLRKLSKFKKLLKKYEQI